jgi:hypothetical protein
MSASADKRKRNQEKGGSGKERYTQEGRERAKIRKIAIITVVIVAVLLGGALFINSDYIRQNFTAVTIGDMKYTVTDFNYYFQNAYMQYYNAISGNAGELASAMLPDSQKPLKSQIYDEETGQTWSEFFQELAITNMQNDAKVYKAAQEAGYQLSDDDMKEFDTEFENTKVEIMSYGYPVFDDYLKGAYGQGMDEEHYKKSTLIAFTAAKYKEYVNDNFTYTDEQLESIYEENKDNFDTYTYRYFLVAADEVNEEDFEDETAYEEAKAAAVAAAGERAKAYADDVKSEEDFIAAAKDYDPETYREADASKRIYQGELLGSTYGDWMKEAGRKTGDLFTVESTNGWYVVYFMERSDNHYDTVGFRQILITPETVNEADYAEEENEDAYNAAVEKARADAKTEADKAYELWLGFDATEDVMIDMMADYSDDTTEGGLYEKVPKGQMVPEVNDWIYDPARKAGDYTMVESEAYGFHILYFTGTGMQYSDYLAETAQREDDLLAWEEALPVIEAETHWTFVLAQ